MSGEWRFENTSYWRFYNEKNTHVATIETNERFAEAGWKALYIVHKGRLQYVNQWPLGVQTLDDKKRYVETLYRMQVVD